MKFIFSSFTVGILTSFAGTLALNEKLRVRRELCQPKFNEDEAVSFMYQWRLKERLNEKKGEQDSELVARAKETVNTVLVPAVRDVVSTVFSINPKQLLDDVMQGNDNGDKKAGEKK